MRRTHTEMRIRLLAVGTRMPSWVNQGYEEYARRLPGDFRLETVELPLGHRGKGADLGRAIRSEGDAMLAAIPKGDRVVALTLDGRPWSTEQLAEQAERWRMSGQNLSLLVGGPDGAGSPLRGCRGPEVVSLQPDPASSTGADTARRAALPCLDPAAGPSLPQMK